MSIGHEKEAVFCSWEGDHRSGTAMVTCQLIN